MTDNIPKIKIKDEIFNEILKGKNFIEKKFTTDRLNFWDRKYHNFCLVKQDIIFKNLINPKCIFEFINKKNKNKILSVKLLDINKIKELNNERIYMIKFKLLGE